MLLEMTARSTPGENGGFLQVSGLKYTIDLNITSSVKVDDKSMFVSVEGLRRVKNVQVLNQAGEYEPIGPGENLHTGIPQLHAEIRRRRHQHVYGQ